MSRPINRLQNLFYLVGCILVFFPASAENKDSIQVVIQDYILQQENDSARQLLNRLNHQDDLEYLREIIDGDAGYNTLSMFIGKMIDRQETNFDVLNEFILQQIEVPQKEEKINKPYVDLMYSLISNLRNNNQLDLAESLNEEFIQYISLFNEEEVNVQKAKAYSLVHQMVLATIQGQIEKSEELGEKLLSIGAAISDTTILIMGNFYLYDTYASARNLEQSIRVAEEAKRLDESRVEKSNFYYENLFHLADVYDYLDQVSGERSDSLLTIIFTIYNNLSTRNKSYELLTRRLISLKDYPQRQKVVLDTLKVGSILEFVEKVKNETSATLFSYDQIYLNKSLAHLLANYGYWAQSNNMLLDMVKQTRKVYSEDLSKSLAEHETSLIRKEKELAIAHEKEQTKLYSFIAVLVGILLLFSIIAFVRQRRQSRLLAEKNAEVEIALQEKQLLLKEVHHRVKNNFQIISSLLELQSKGIEDEKAKELASEGRNRVKSMALIHQRLYQNDDLLIYFNDYIDKLVSEISTMYGANKNAEITIDVDKVAFDIDTAIPLGLIVNELVTNAFKYGQVESEQQKISITIYKGEKDFYKLEVKDNGAGLPENLDVSKAKSLGLRLVRRLSKQLQGSINYYNQNGAIFEVLFKNTQARSLVD